MFPLLLLSILQMRPLVDKEINTVNVFLTLFILGICPPERPIWITGHKLDATDLGQTHRSGTG